MNWCSSAANTIFYKAQADNSRLHDRCRVLMEELTHWKGRYWQKGVAISTQTEQTKTKICTNIYQLNVKFTKSNENDKRMSTGNIYLRIWHKRIHMLPLLNSLVLNVFHFLALWNSTIPSNFIFANISKRCLFVIT